MLRKRRKLSRHRMHSLPLGERTIIKIFYSKAKEYIKVVLKPSDTAKGVVTFIHYSSVSLEMLAKLFGEIRHSRTGGYYIPYVVTCIKQDDNHLVTSRYQYHWEYGHRIMTCKHEDKHIAHINGTWYLK